MIKWPVPIGLMVCDQVIVEEQSRNLSLINCFTVRKVASFPTPPQTLAVVAFLIDGFGEGDLTIIFQQLATGEEIYRIQQRINFTDPLRRGRLVCRINNLVFPSPGGYEVSLLIDRELLARSDFRILELEKSP
jgi:hypothetical protein